MQITKPIITVRLSFWLLLFFFNTPPTADAIKKINQNENKCAMKLIIEFIELGYGVHFYFSSVSKQVCRD